MLSLSRDDYGVLIARALIAAIFIYFGIMQFIEIAQYATRPGVIKFASWMANILSPTIIAWLVAIVDLVGGLLVLVGYRTRIASIVLFAFVLLTLLLAHDFWNMEGAARAANIAHFMKNLAIMGALILIAVHGPGRASVEAYSRA
jgi:putative oxidoreductase